MPDWLVELMDSVARAGADGGFGTVQAIYPPGAPEWVSALDLHSSHPERFGSGWAEKPRQETASPAGH